MSRTIVLLCLIAGLASCSRTREFEVVGQIVAIAPDQHQVTIKHQDIKGFMPGMTMPFEVRDSGVLSAKKPGDLVRATLVVGETDAHISSITKTGHAPLDAPPPAPPPAVLQAGQTVADASFVDQAGMPKMLSNFRGHRVALTFIYTRCPVPNFCPLMSKHFSTLQKTIKQRPDLADVRLISVTLDPTYDRPPVLQAYARSFDADPAIWTFLTTKPEAVSAFTTQFGIFSETDREDPAQLIHNLQTAVIDPDGRLVHNIHGNDWTPADILAQLTTASASRH